MLINLTPNALVPELEAELKRLGVWSSRLLDSSGAGHRARVILCFINIRVCLSTAAAHSYILISPLFSFPY